MLLLRFLSAEYDGTEAAAYFHQLNLVKMAPQQRNLHAIDGECGAHVELTSNEIASLTMQLDRSKSAFDELLAEQRDVHAVIAECVGQLYEVATELRAKPQHFACQRSSPTADSIPHANASEEQGGATRAPANSAQSSPELGPASSSANEEMDILDQLVQFGARKKRENSWFFRSAK